MAATLINPCDITTTTGQNTGVECSSSLGVAKGIFIVPASDVWTATDMADPVTFIRTRIHATGSQRWYPVLKGIFDFAIANESDVSESNPITGISSRLRAGGFTLTYTYEEGGLCLAKALLGFQGKGYRFIAVDQNSQFLVRKNADGTYSGLKSSDISSSIIPASASAKFKNTLILAVSQSEYITYSYLLKSSDDITDFNGLIDTNITKAAAGSTTKLKIGVQTECAKTDLVAVYGAALAVLGLYIITNKATGVVITATGAALASGNIELTGTYVSGQTYIVKGSAPSVWLAASIEGYDATDGGVEILIP